jgi:hypothetical protein
MRPLRGGLLGGKILRNVSRYARRLASASDPPANDSATALLRLPEIDVATEIAAACSINSLLVSTTFSFYFKILRSNIRPELSCLVHKAESPRSQGAGICIQTRRRTKKVKDPRSSKGYTLPTMKNHMILHIRIILPKQSHIFLTMIFVL